MIKIDIKNFQTQLNKKIEDFEEEKQRILEDVGIMMVGDTDERFEKEVDPEGTPWKDWSPKTIENYKRLSKKTKEVSLSNKKNQMTGRMKGTVSTFKVRKGKQFLGITLSQDEVYIGSNLPYARRNQKLRPYLGFSQRLRNKIVRRIKEGLGGI